MKEVTIEEIRQIQLDILQKIHDFCLEKGYRYSLGGGSLLGAVRHKGYIPWDDDIDIMMPRPDYEKLWREFVGKYENLGVQNYYTDPSYVMRHTRIYDKQTYLVSTNAIGGVFVDVFAIDGLPPYDLFMSSYIKRYKSLQVRLRRTTQLHDEIQWGKKIWRIKNFFKSPFRIFRPLVIKQYEKLFDSYPFESSDYAGAITGMYGEKEYMQAEVFRHYTELPFEGHQFMAIADYDAYLAKHYGDYMQLPPEEKRVTHHKFKIYWKE